MYVCIVWVVCYCVVGSLLYPMYSVVLLVLGVLCTVCLAFYALRVRRVLRVLSDRCVRYCILYGMSCSFCSTVCNALTAIRAMRGVLCMAFHVQCSIPLLSCVLRIVMYFVRYRSLPSDTFYIVL